MRLADFEPSALGATAALLSFHAVRQPFQAQGRLPVTSKDQTVNLNLMSSEEFLPPTSPIFLK